jgi:protein-S-isoprenylcysteine O-methyltransferase Ste14
MKADQDSAQVTFPPPFVYLGFLLIGIAADRWLPWSFELTEDIRFALAGALAAMGLYLLIGAQGRFRRAGTDLKPWKATTAVVDHGVYGFTRNPMYLGMALIYVALAVAFLSIGALILLPLVIFVIRTQVIAREERYLESKFGDAYLAYKQRVRRWL